MKFEIINNNEGNLEYKGYRFVASSERHFDVELEKTERIDRGNIFVDNKFDDFCDGYEPICKGEDGKLYSVLFLHYSDSEDKPFIWREVEKA